MRKDLILKISIVGIIVIGIILLVVFREDPYREVSTGSTFDLHTSSSFVKEQFLDDGYPMMIDVGGAECIPCKEMAPTLEKLNEDLKDQAIIKFVDVWEYPALGNQFDVVTIPSQFFYDADGNFYKKHEGPMNEQQILSVFAEMGYNFG